MRPKKTFEELEAHKLKAKKANADSKLRKKAMTDSLKSIYAHQAKLAGKATDPELGREIDPKTGKFKNIPVLDNVTSRNDSPRSSERSEETSRRVLSLKKMKFKIVTESQLKRIVKG